MRIRRRRATLVASLWSLGVAATAVGPTQIAAQTAEDPSNVVLVFDVSNSILLSDDGTNVEFAAALTDIADRVKANAEDLAAGNAEISFVVFGRTAITYPSGCDRVALHEDPGAIAQLETCLRRIAAEYRAGPNAAIRQRINTQDTDHVAALREAADLLPDASVRSAVIFFTDGRHDPPGTTRDDEDVVAAVRAAYQGRTPLAILPVGLGAGAGEFESELRAIYDAYFRDMEPCEGRASFSWPEVVFPSADAAGIAVANALQEVTCSFTFAPPPTAPPTPSPTPSPLPGPVSVQLLAGNQSVTVQWLPPVGADEVTDYAVQCRPQGGGDDTWIDSTEGVSTTPETTVFGLTGGVSYECRVAAIGPTGASEYTTSSEAVVVLAIPAAPGQPRVEPRDGGARVTIDPIVGGVPVEQYVVECTGSGGVASGLGAQPPIDVVGLANGDTVTCVAYAQNRVGRSPASLASAPFSPCAGLDCNPILKYGVIGGVLAAALLVIGYLMRRYQQRNRVWVTAQVDGGENLPLGWGPDLGVRLERDEGGGSWFARALPHTRDGAGAGIRVRYQGRSRFLVSSGSSTRDVHQGDPTPVRDDAGALHTLILRKYRGKPRERGVAKAAPAPAETRAADELGTRLEGKDDRPAPGSQDDGWVR